MALFAFSQSQSGVEFSAPPVIIIQNFQFFSCKNKLRKF